MSDHLIEVTIRPARLSDAAEWETLRQRLWPSPAGEHAGEIARFFQGTLPEPVEVLVAIADEGLIGMAELSIRTFVDGCRSDRVGYLEGWYVLDEWRRRGVGRRLVEAAIGWARERGCHEFGSDTELENVESQAAHAALGFEVTARLVAYRLDIGS